MFARFCGALIVTALLGTVLVSIFSYIWTATRYNPLEVIGGISAIFCGFVYAVHIYNHIKYGHDKK